MEENFAPDIFLLQVDNGNIPYLKEAAKWAKFLAIMGFIFCGIMLIAALFAGTILSSSLSQVETSSQESSLFNKLSGGITVVYILLALIFFIPYLFLFNFASKMQTALRNNDQINLNTSFKNLKLCFKFWGILLVIILCFYALFFIIFALLGSAFMH